MTRFSSQSTQRIPLPPIKVALVDADSTFRGSLCAMLEEDSGFVVCASIGQATENAFTNVPLPDVVCIDVIGKPTSAAFISRFVRHQPRTRFLVCTDDADTATVFAMFKAGAGGYVLKSHGLENIRDAVEELHRGGIPVTDAVLSAMIATLRNDTPSDDLTRRESEILNLLGEGLQYAQIGDRLNVSLPTVRSHVQHIYRKLGVTSRTQALLKAKPNRGFRG